LPLFYEVSQHPCIDSATYIAQRPLNEKRIKQGWQAELKTDAQIVISPTNSEIDRIISGSPKNSVHVFSGMHWAPCIVNGLKAAIKYRRRFGILSEPRVFEGLKGFARLAHSWMTEANLRQRTSFVLAIGAHGPAWFRMAGYPSKVIFPFAYFLPNLVGAAPAASPINGQLPVASYLGRLERAKGVHLFLDCIPLVQNRVKFKVAGYGALEPDVVKTGSRYRDFHFLGTLPMARVPEFLTETDILVLPSITMDDGWGAVVSEALMAGAAVVSTFKVGASICLGERARGIVIRDFSGSDIATAIDALIDEGYTSQHHRAMRAAWATKRLDQAAGAQYLLEIFDHLFAGKARPLSFLEARA
jgi:glycosyltransferase involved in cell wall biosynthesis